jgi:hypothetical protein
MIGERSATTRSCLEARAEVLFWTARFWTSRAQFEDDGQRHIRDVEGLMNTTSTLMTLPLPIGMARWNLRRAIEVATLMRERWLKRSGRPTRSIRFDVLFWIGQPDSPSKGSLAHGSLRRFRSS